MSNEARLNVFDELYAEAYDGHVYGLEADEDGNVLSLDVQLALLGII